MLPSGPMTPVGGAPSISSSFLRSNSSTLGSQGGLVHQQATFSSLISPQSQYSMSLLGSNPNMSSLLNQNFGNGENTGLSGLCAFQRGSVDTTAESVGSDVSFAASSFAASNVSNIGSSLQGQNQQIVNNAATNTLLDQQQSNVQQFQPKKFQSGQQMMHHFPVSNRPGQQQQSQLQSLQRGLGVPLKMGPQVVNNSIGLPEQLQSSRNLGPIKLESRKDQVVRGMGPAKLEDRHSDQAIVLKQRMQQQQFLQMSRQPLQDTAPQMNLLQQQCLFQLQQHQQQQLLKAIPQQQPQLQQQPQNMISRSAGRPTYETGMCAWRLTQYIYQQQQRPNDNNIEFWRKFVAEFFDPIAKKRWCISLHNNSRQTHGVFPEDIWHCDICNRKPGRGFESTVEVLPRLFQVNYESGTLEELLYVDMPCEYQNEAGQIVLDYAKAVEESVLEHVRVVREGQLRIVFSQDLKICSWEFCTRRHEELIPRRLILTQVSQLGAVAHKYQVSAQSASSNLPALDLQSNCNMFLSSARQLVKALEMPLVNELGCTKRYVRCLQISEVVNSMKDLIDHSQQTGKGAIESLAKFPRKTSRASGLHISAQQPDEKRQSSEPILNINHHSAQANTVQPSTSSGVSSVSNSHGTTSTTTSATTVAGLLRQNSMNSHIENQMNNPSSPYVGTPVQIPSAGSSTTLPATQPNPSSPFSSSTPSSSNNPNQMSQNVSTVSATTSHINPRSLAAQIPVQQSSQINDSDPNEPPSSLEKLLQEILNSPQFGEAVDAAPYNLAVNNAKRLKRSTKEGKNLAISSNRLGGNNIANNSSGVMDGGHGNLVGQNGPSATNARIGAAMGSNLATLAGRAGMPTIHQEASMNNQQQQELANRFLKDIGAMTSVSNLQYDWKSARRG